MRLLLCALLLILSPLRAEDAALTPVRIALLPQPFRVAWAEYHARSQMQRALDAASLDAELRDHDLWQFTAAPEGGSPLPESKPDGWYAGDEARRLAAVVVSYQTPSGGWSKAVDYKEPRPPAGLYAHSAGYTGTFDNNATVREIRFLARVAVATGDTACRQAAERGIGYVLGAQFPNGGWPQVWPLMGGYHDALTYNDNATLNALRLLRDAATGREPFATLPPALRQRAADAVARGVACILATQVVVNGGRTAWGQQHDALTLQPCAARAFEPVALSSAESSGLLRFLIELKSDRPDIAAAIESAARWFEKTALRGQAWKSIDGDHQLTPAPGLLWARFYEIGTDRPLFGDRDRTLHYDVREISHERRNGYAWYSDNPQTALKKYEAWRARR